MKLGTVVLAIAIALPATATFAQTRTPGSPAARQDVGDPSVQHRTSEQRSAGVTRKQVRHNAPKLRQHVGGPTSSQQSGSLSE